MVLQIIQNIFVENNKNKKNENNKQTSNNNQNKHPFEIRKEKHENRSRNNQNNNRRNNRNNYERRNNNYEYEEGGLRKRYNAVVHNYEQLERSVDLMNCKISTIKLWMIRQDCLTRKTETMTN